MEYAAIRSFVIGGVNEDWAEGTARRAAPASPKRASIDPMRGSLPADRADDDDLDQDVLDLMAEDGFSAEGDEDDKWM